jgi:dihydroxy-acid dehydratase
LPLRDLIPAVREGVEEAGGLPVVFPVMSLGEDLMKPTAMLYRNLVAMEIEETLRSYPLDGAVLLANCDKTVPAALMGAASSGLPSLLLTGGPRVPCLFRGRRLGAGTDLWRLWDERRRGVLDDEAWAELESCLASTRGACNTIGTASTMAVLAEVLGFSLPGSSTIPAGDPRQREVARRSGRRVVELVRARTALADICTSESVRNALVALNAIGGSTNAVLHLAAICGRLGLAFDLDAVDRLGRRVPLLADLKPTGSQLVDDFDAAGGVPALLGVLAEFLSPDCVLADGRRVSDVAATACTPHNRTIRTLADPVSTGGAFRVVRGSLAPEGALLKRSTATTSLLNHRGRAVVFRGYEEMRAKAEDPTLDVDEDSVLVLAGAGPVGGPGMPEWGMIPLPRKLLDAGVSDIVRVTDARMSGTSFGTVVLHVAPEAAVGGPIGLVRDGDWVELDADAGRLELLVDPAELNRRRAHLPPPVPRHERGWASIYLAHVTQAPLGCDFDVLRVVPGERPGLVEPVVGRS